MTGMNRDLVVKALLDENGYKHVAWVCVQPFMLEPEVAAAEMRLLIPADALPDIVFLMAKDYVLAGIEPGDESAKAQKKVSERWAFVKKYFEKEIEEGGRRAIGKLRREIGRR